MIEKVHGTNSLTIYLRANMKHKRGASYFRSAKSKGTETDSPLSMSVSNYTVASIHIATEYCDTCNVFVVWINRHQQSLKHMNQLMATMKSNQFAANSALSALISTLSTPPSLVASDDGDLPQAAPAEIEQCM